MPLLGVARLPRQPRYGCCPVLKVGGFTGGSFSLPTAEGNNTLILRSSRLSPLTNVQLLPLSLETPIMNDSPTNTPSGTLILIVTGNTANTCLPIVVTWVGSPGDIERI